MRLARSIAGHAGGRGRRGKNEFHGKRENGRQPIDKIVEILYTIYNMTKYQKNTGSMDALKHRHPHLKILNRQPANERIKIRLEYTQDAFDKLEGEEKLIMEKHVETLMSFGKRFGRGTAIELLAALGQVLDDADWPKENPGPFDWMNDSD